VRIAQDSVDRAAESSVAFAWISKSAFLDSNERIVPISHGRSRVNQRARSSQPAAIPAGAKPFVFGELAAIVLAEGAEQPLSFQ
jgi:hypothetical protein